MLKKLSGDTHRVYTGYAIRSENKTVCDFCLTEVTFRELDDKEILDYIKTGEPMDKAGAYGIQNPYINLVKEFSGEYENIVGLPLKRLKKELEKL